MRATLAKRIIGGLLAAAGLIVMIAIRQEIAGRIPGLMLMAIGVAIFVWGFRRE
jgi:uncharacterized protein YjeT (DUF2065 family)